MILRYISAFCSLLLTAGFISAANACPIVDDGTVTRLTSDQYDVAMKTIPETVTVGELFAVDLEICRKDGTPFTGTVKAAANMPAHKHGMNYQPEIASRDRDTFHLQGFAFHMQGQWQYAFELRENGGTELLLLDHDLK